MGINSVKILIIHRQCIDYLCKIKFMINIFFSKLYKEKLIWKLEDENLT